MNASRKYAAIWSIAEEVGSRRVEVHPDRFDLCGRHSRVGILLSKLTGAWIERRREQRLRGLSVLVLDLGRNGAIRVSSLEGTAVLHELAGLAIDARRVGDDGFKRDVGDERRSGAGRRLHGKRAA